MASVLDDYEEKVGSGNELIDMLNGKFTVTRIFQGPYLDRIKFVKTFLNQAVRKGLHGTIRFPFQEHPKHKGLFATKAAIKGTLGADQTVALGTIEYKTAIITITYEALPFKQPQGAAGDNVENEPLFDFIEETSDASLEILSIPGEDVIVKNDADEDEPQHDQGPKRVVIVYLNINIRQPFVAKPQWDQIMQNLGRVNRDIFFTPGGKIALPGTVRYDGPSDRIKIDALGPRNILWDISHKFIYNRHGWHFGWVKGKFRELNPHIFEDGDLMQIFFGQANRGLDDFALGEINDLQDQIQTLIDLGELSIVQEQRLLLLTVRRDKLIRNMGGNLLDWEPELDD